MLTNQFCDQAGVPPGTSLKDFLDGLRDAPHDCLDGLLGTDDGKTAAIGSLAQLDYHNVRVVRQLAGVQEKYCSVQIEGEASPVRLALLGDCEAVCFPTEMENLILWGIVQSASPIGTVWTGDPGRRILDWRRQAKGLAVIAEPLPVRDEVSRTVASLFGLEDGGLGSTDVLAPVSAMATDLYVGAPTRAFSPVQARLFFEAVATSHPKWRFLSFYRLLESAYLTNIKRVLIAEFDKDAKSAVADAERKLKTEVNQLIDLMTERRLEDEFLEFNAEFDNLNAGGNNYIIALDRSAQADPLYGGREVTKKAVLRFYKMRCSIAHAGTSSVIFEQMHDSIAATTALLPFVEAIVLKSLSIVVR